MNFKMVKKNIQNYRSLNLRINNDNKIQRFRDTIECNYGKGGWGLFDTKE